MGWRPGRPCASRSSRDTHQDRGKRGIRRACRSISRWPPPSPRRRFMATTDQAQRGAVMQRVEQREEAFAAYGERHLHTVQEQRIGENFAASARWRGALTVSASLHRHPRERHNEVAHHAQSAARFPRSIPQVAALIQRCPPRCEGSGSGYAAPARGRPGRRAPPPDISLRRPDAPNAGRPEALVD